ncbi:TIGR04283 family arsenosugar biosynthesis glycosyltransferase [Desulfoluna spongiiphila]|uniref:Glycosyltransferase involved in cell wall bisynthesis n=1 Tax=Desulfoluna spongiiphila TaxID=419481 RepID=A0A1G5BQR4_9BACT|nr:glycosyltransferase family 2 protein [Desulfoluna spongiiphila]SCX92528.1 Glycosyltransferase involved in cell wall bisynthesis [Desulfoluna spongiiphila]
MNTHPPFPTLSAVIPTLNEEAGIAEAVGSLAMGAPFLEIVVADAGSTDATCSLAEAAGARVVQCTRKGRGLQIAEAWATCRGDVLVVLHADARFPAHGAAAIQGALAHSTVPGGAFSMGFSPATARTRLITGLNHLRCHITGISFGDQCQFVRRSVLDSSGGFPPMKLMEDVELSLIMKRTAKPVILPQRVTVSPRRWESTPFSQGVARVLFLFFVYLVRRKLGCSPGDGSWYHKKYYKRMSPETTE